MAESTGGSQLTWPDRLFRLDDIDRTSNFNTVPYFRQEKTMDISGRIVLFLKMERPLRPQGLCASLD